MERGWRDTNQVKKSFALNGCGSRGRERTILNRTCVRNLEVNEEEIKEWENEKRNQGEKKCQDQIRKDWGIMWTTDNKTTRLKRGFRRNKRREGEKIQTIVKTYTQNKEAKEDEKKQWHGKCKERKKSTQKTLWQKESTLSVKRMRCDHIKNQFWPCRRYSQTQCNFPKGNCILFGNITRRINKSIEELFNFPAISSNSYSLQRMCEWQSLSKTEFHSYFTCQSKILSYNWGLW